MTPILVLATAAAARVLGPEAAKAEVVAQVGSLVGHAGARAVEALIAGPMTDYGFAATLVAGVLSLIVAAAVFVELKASLDELWGIEPPKGRAIIAFLRTQLHSFGVVLVLAFLLLVSLALSAALALLERFAGARWSGWPVV